MDLPGTAEACAQRPVLATFARSLHHLSLASQNLFAGFKNLESWHEFYASDGREGRWGFLGGMYLRMPTLTAAPVFVCRSIAGTATSL